MVQAYLKLIDTFNYTWVAARAYLNDIHSINRKREWQTAVDAFYEAVKEYDEHNG